MVLFTLMILSKPTGGLWVSALTVKPMKKPSGTTCKNALSDDALMQRLIPRLSDLEIEEIFSLVTDLMKKHLSEPEYHRLFLKDNSH